MKSPVTCRTELDIPEKVKPFIFQSAVRLQRRRNIFNWAFLERLLLNTTGWSVLLMCGMFVGFLTGHLVGSCVGTVYAEYFGPVYFSDYADLAEIVYWLELSNRLAVRGQAIGFLVGPFCTVIIAMIYTKSLSRQSA